MSDRKNAIGSPLPLTFGEDDGQIPSTSHPGSQTAAHENISTSSEGQEQLVDWNSKFNPMIIQNIIGNLHGEDLKNCRLVCTKWRNASLFQFKAEMTTVVDDLTPRFPNTRNKHRLRSFEAFFREFGESDKGIPVDSFKLIMPIKFNPWYLKWLDLYGPGIKNFEVVFHVSHPTVMDGFRSVIFTYIRNIENFSLIFVQSSLQGLSFEYYFPKDYPNLLRYIKNFELRRLTKVKCIVEDGSFAMEMSVRHILFDIISATENLKSLEMNMVPSNTSALLMIPERNLRTLKEMTLTNQKCTNVQNVQAIINLERAGRWGKIKLHSFSVHCIYTHFDYTDIQEVLHPLALIKFLRSQRKCLKSLSIHHLPIYGSVLKKEDENVLRELLLIEELVFPTMEKLQKLSVCDSYGNAAWPLQFYADWGKFFPILKTLEYHYIVEEHGPIKPQLLKKLRNSMPSVTEVTLAVNELTYSWLSRRPKRKNTPFVLLQLISEKFPNMTSLTLLGDKTGIYSDSSQKKDFASYFPNTLVFSLIKHDNSGDILIHEYKRTLEIAEEIKHYWELLDMLHAFNISLYC